MFDEIEGAIKLLNQGSDVHQAMAGRLRAILDAECIPTYDLLPVLGEIRKKNLLPEDAVLSLILNVAQYCSRVVAKELVGEREDFDDLCANRFDDLVAKLTETIEEFVRSSPLPISQIEAAISTAAEQFDRSVIAPEYQALFKKANTQELRRLLAEVDSADIAEMIEIKPMELLERKQNGERLLTGKTNSERDWEEFKAYVERS